MQITPVSYNYTNKVQKNNQQSFGMGVRCRDSETRRFLNKIVDAFGIEGKNSVRECVRTITQERAGDHRANLVLWKSFEPPYKIGLDLLDIHNGKSIPNGHCGFIDNEISGAEIMKRLEIANQAAKAIEETSQLIK